MKQKEKQNCIFLLQIIIGMYRGGGERGSTLWVCRVIFKTQWRLWSWFQPVVWSMAMIPPVQLNHTWIEEHTVEHCQSWTSLPRARHYWSCVGLSWHRTEQRQKPPKKSFEFPSWRATIPENDLKQPQSVQCCLSSWLELCNICLQISINHSKYFLFS